GRDFFSEMKPVVAGVLRGFDSQVFGDLSGSMFFSGEFSSMFYEDFYAKELCGDYSDAFSSGGLEFYASGDFDRASKLFLKAIAFDPYNSQALYNLAASSYETGRYEDALKYYGFARVALDKEYRDKRTAPFIDKSLARNYNNTGAVYEKLGKDDEALDCYKKSVEKDHDFAQGYYNCGVIYWKKKDWAQVISSFEACLKADPQNSQARRYLEMLKGEGGRL
ncbi:MAG: tetratricopeptide repeat protein, partial [Candidatus Omnitrophota bacterium]